MKDGRVILLLFVVVLISVVVLAGSVHLLPDAPLYPTPTPPKGIDFPDIRPVPAH